MKRVSGAIKKFILKKNSTEIDESDSHPVPLKDQDLHNLAVSPVWPSEQATSSSTSSGQQCDKDSKNETTALILALCKIVRILCLDPSVFQQLSEIF